MRLFGYTSGIALVIIMAACDAATSERGEDFVDVDVLGSSSPNGKKPPKNDTGSSSGSDSGTDAATDSGTDTGASTGTDSGTGTGSTGSFVDACLLPGGSVVSFEPTSTMDPNDEGVTKAIPLPFVFTYFGTTYSHYWLTSNGALGFGTTPAANAFGQVTCPLPDSNIASPMVFVYSADLMSGTACVATTGTAPNRKLVITWKDKIFYELDGTGNGTSNVAFGATLSEGTNAIDLAVHRVDASSSFFSCSDVIKGSWAAIGLQSGTAAAPFSCHANDAPPGSVFHYAP